MDDKQRYMAVSRARLVLRPHLAELLEQAGGDGSAVVQALEAELACLRARKELDERPKEAA